MFRYWAILLLCFNVSAFFAQQPPIPYTGNLDLHEQFNGNYSYALFGNSLLPSSNQVPGNCFFLDSSTATFQNPNQYPIKQAYLYYAATGYAIEEVYLNDQKADFIRRDTYAFSGSPNSYFFAKADVTQIIREGGEGEYSFSGLEELSGNIIYDYCFEAKTSGGMCGINGDLFAGWTVLVIYEDFSLPYNSISIFDGFRFISDTDLPVIDVNTSDASKASLSFLSWEGDFSGANEWLLFNGQPLENEYNSYPNQMYNQSNSFTGDRLWGMDLDHFDLTDLVDSSTTQAAINFNSSGMCSDFAILQLAVLEIENRLPNPGIEILSARPSICGNTDVDIKIRVTNYNTTEVLPAGTQVNFYSVIERPLIETLYTDQALPANGSLVMETTVTIPNLVNTVAGVEVEINKDVSGNTIIPELNPQDNNEEIIVNDMGKATLFFPNAFSPNGDGVNDGFGLLNGELCKGNIKDFHLEIYHPYGEKFFITDQMFDRWDGQINGEPAAQATYLYTATYRSALTGQQYRESGTTTLMR